MYRKRARQLTVANISGGRGVVVVVILAVVFLVTMVIGCCGCCRIGAVGPRTILMPIRPLRSVGSLWGLFARLVRECPRQMGKEVGARGNGHGNRQARVNGNMTR